MAYKFREEIVGKRFLSVSDFTKLKVNKIREWGWRAGVIRAASHRDYNCHDLQVLVEYDDVEWQRREWLSPHRDTGFSFFLIEKGLCWSERLDPRHHSLVNIDHYNNHHHSNNNHQHRINGKPIKGATTSTTTVAWPAITFYPIVKRAELTEDMMPIEFMQDKRLEFVDYSKLKPFTDWELTKGTIPWANAVRRWAEMQDGQRILLTTPSVLVGFRVEVYRAEGTTQWYTAVIVGYNESTKDLTVTDDTVLEDHNEDPGLVQMRLIGDGVVECIMRGEVVGMTPRRSRSSTGLMTHAIVVPRVPRRPRGRPGNSALPGSQSPVSQHLEKDKGSVKNNRRRRISEGTGREKTESSRQEDRENKGPTTGKLSNYTTRSVLEETNNASGSAAKLRKRATGLRNVETNQRRLIRNRRTRTEVRQENLNDDNHTDDIKIKEDRLVKSDDENISENEIEGEEEEREEIEAESEAEEFEENQHHRDSLIKRFKTAKKLKTDKNQVGSNKEPTLKEIKKRNQEKEKKETSISGLKSQAKAEEDESESRERDREPEPPPQSSLTTNDRTKKQKDSQINVSLDESISIKDNLEVKPTVETSSVNVTTTTTTVSTTTTVTSIIPSETDIPSVDKSGRATSVKSVEFVESSSQDGSVLDRLSPLSGGGPGRQSLLHDEQERNRHNESPVILAERINKPPPPHLQQHQQQQQQQQKQKQQQQQQQQQQHHHHQHSQHSHHQYHQYQHIHQPRYTTSPVIRLESSSPHHQNRHHSTLIEVSDKSQSQLLQSRHGDEAGGHLMEVETGGGGLASVVGVVASGVRGAAYGDSGSDSGISSLRSAGSGDERSGSRSSALSAEDTTTAIITTAATTNIQQSSSVVQSPHQPSQIQSATPARIWHVHSVQHQSLMMAHQQAAGQTMPANNTQVGYQNSATGHHHHHHHPSVGSDMLWRAPRYPPLSLLAPGQPTPDEMLERDRHERMIRERREAEVRELEKRDREAKMERERLEKQRAAEQAVHKHFEESLRLAHQKVSYVPQRNMPSASMAWNSFIPLPPPGTRSHGGPPQSHASLTSHGHHPSSGSGGGGGGGGPTHSAVAQHQRERDERDARERERERERDSQAREREHREREREHLVVTERLHRQAEARDHVAAQHRAAFYPTTAPPTAQVLRPSGVPSKVDYPPPPAHSRTSKQSLPVVSLHEKSQVVSGPSPHSSLPKAEPNVSLFGYSSYPPPQSSYIHDIKVKNDLQHKSIPGKSLGSHERDHHGRDMLPNPPPLLPDHKNSVIVKNDQGRDHQKVPPPHSSSPKMMSYLNVQSVGSQQAQQQSQHKSVTYEYRSPTQSPHHLHHLENLQAKGLPTQSHHRANVPPQSQLSQNPHVHSVHPHNRQSPHNQPHPHQTQPHPSPPEPRYLNRIESGSPYSTGKTVYLYQHPQKTSPTPHYATPPSGSKAKVPPPAPPHMYTSCPHSGIMTGTPVCRATSESVASAPMPLTSKAGSSPYQQVSHHHGAPPQHLPPPAHSTRSLYDSRGFSGAMPSSKLPPPQIHGSPPTAASAPLSRSVVTHLSHHVSPHQSTPTIQHSPASISASFQTQPLDLGVERSNSPKRKAPTPSDHIGHPVSLEIKKRRIEEPQPLSLQCVGPPVLSRVSEPSPLIASAATSITTVVNTVLLSQTNAQTQQEQTVVSISPAPRTASGDGSIRPASTGSVNSFNPPPNTAPSPVPVASPAPTNAAPSPAPSAPGTPAKINPTNTDSEKSNSPAPRPPSRTNYPVHKLKKAWLQRHSGEDGTEDTTGVIGSGSCVTLPLNIAQVPSQPLNKERESTSGMTAAATTTSLPSAVNSIHNVGSLAINSINKSKVTGKAGRKPANKETLNGHANDSKSIQEDSSSSDPERKSPPKRKPPKVKRKKGAARRQQAIVEEQRRRKDDKQVGVGTGAGSDSSNESEAGSASDASEQLSSSVQPTPRRHTTANSNNSSGNGSNKEPRKRGRRPKNSKGNNDAGGDDLQPRQKKERRDDSSSGGGEGGGNGQSGGNGKSNPFCKPPISQLKKTGDSWLQDHACCEVAPKLAKLSKCRECRWYSRGPPSRIKKQSVFCRFYAFRRLRYTKNGQLAIAGFSDPHKDASQEDIALWLPANQQQIRDKNGKSEKSNKEKGADRADLDLEMAHRLLRQVGDQFCDLLKQEKEALAEHMSDASSGIVDGTVAWKRVVQGVREMCDVCETTLFNYHWVCAKCGFAVCIDCFKGRKNGTVKIWGESGKDRDDFSWLLCTNRHAHAPERLMLTQIIAGDSLPQLGQRLHDVRAEWGIPQHCSCSIVSSMPMNETLRSLIKGDTVTVTNGNIKQEVKEEKCNNDANGGSESKTNGEDKNSPLNWLADVALQNQNKNDSGSSSDSDEDRDGNYSTLRELLIRPSNKPNGSGSRSNSPTNNSNSPQVNNPPVNNVKLSKKSKMDTLDEVISSVIEHTVKKERDGVDTDEKSRELKHFVRRYKWIQRGREPLPIRIMTLTESKCLYPDVPHSWLCDGKLLRLCDPNNVNNYRIFQDQWKRGQPVIVSDVSKSLNMDLWHPDSFARDFGSEKNDLVNCMNNHLVPNQPMRKFWEGFEHFSKRLKDDKGNPMLLKLKDWPPGEDFAELLPSRYADLMKVLPLSEYTHRNGRLNLASRLPDCFVRPDLGPKMYNAYGSALHPTKGTTNLHLDISDAVNVMVYVGIPKDSDNDEHVKEALRAVDEAGCDILTRRRVRDRGEAPGALWHIYAARDADKIRDLLNAVALERGARLEPHHDPIHDQSCYLDGPLRERLYREYGVEGYAIVQCLGDAVFVPAGAPHQVRNLHNCIKVAEDFVSPENVSHCFHLTQEFRALSDTHTNHEDKLQIKNIIYHAVKDSLTVLANAKHETLSKHVTKNEIKMKEET